MAKAAHDQYREYFTEKIWSLIPAFYRDDDGLADWPDVLRPRGAALVDTPFDEFFHHGDVRRHQGGLDGRSNIPKVAFHLYRIPAHEIAGVEPAAGPNTHAFSVDPSGRDIPLFQRRALPED